MCYCTKTFFPMLSTPTAYKTIYFVDSLQMPILWSKLQNCILQLCNIELFLSPPDILYGIIRQLTPPCLAKYFLYVNRQNNKAFSFVDFIQFVWDKTELEKHIAATSGEKNVSLKMAEFGYKQCKYCLYK